MDADVIIIGGGASGLCAAAALEAAGLRCLLVEGRDCLGGRVRSSASGIDLGAQWIHGDRNTPANPLLELARSARLPLRAFDCENAATYDWRGQQTPDAEVDRWEGAWRRVERALPSRTEPTVAARIEAVLSELRLAPALENGVRHCAATFIEGEFGADAAWLCGRGYDEGAGILGKDHVLPAGLHSAIPALASALKSTRVLLGRAASSVQRGAGRVRVTAGEEAFTARAALVTVPLGVLQQGLGVRGVLLPRVEGSAVLHFSPPLPAPHAAAIAALGMGLLNKYILEWDAGVQLGALPAGVEMLEYLDAPQGTRHFPELLVLRHHSPQHNALMAFASGSRALALGALSDEAVLAALLAQLRGMLGGGLPPPRAFTRTRWEADPFACGAYSFLPPGVSPAQRDALAQGVEGVLWFAGEHVCGDHPATVHGAMLSGQRAAASIAAALRSAGAGEDGAGAGAGAGATQAGAVGPKGSV